MNREVHNAVWSEAQAQFQTTKGVTAEQLSTFWLTSGYHAGVHQWNGCRDLSSRIKSWESLFVSLLVSHFPCLVLSFLCGKLIINYMNGNIHLVSVIRLYSMTSYLSLLLAIRIFSLTSQWLFIKLYLSYFLKAELHLLSCWEDSSQGLLLYWQEDLEKRRNRAIPQQSIWVPEPSKKRMWSLWNVNIQVKICHSRIQYFTEVAIHKWILVAFVLFWSVSFHHFQVNIVALMYPWEQSGRDVTGQTTAISGGGKGGEKRREEKSSFFLLGVFFLWHHFWKW